MPTATIFNGDTSSWFQVETDVRQGCILSPLLFAIVIDWVLRRTMDNSTGGISWTEDESLCDLDFADDIALLDDSWNSMQQTTSTLTVRLCISKTLNVYAWGYKVPPRSLANSARLR